MDCEFNESDERCASLEKAITKLYKSLARLEEFFVTPFTTEEGTPFTTEECTPFTTEECTTSYTDVYTICNQRPPNIKDVEHLYCKYRQVYEIYIASTVLPSLSGMHDEVLLNEFVKRWESHKIMMRWLSLFFTYLDRHYTKRKHLPTLDEVGVACFRDMVYAKLNAKAIDVVIGLIEKDREGVRVDRVFIKNVVDSFVEMNVTDKLKCYQQDFEAALLENTGMHYSRLASGWIQEDSFPVYVGKVEKCLQIERERVSNYLHPSSEHKLVARIKHEMLTIYKTELLGKEDLGFLALLRQDKVEEISRIFRLYHDIPEGLELGAHIFKQHICSEGTKFVQEAKDLSTSLVIRISDLHDKSMVYVNSCFEKHEFFHKALTEAFEFLCKKTVSNTSITELLSMFCDDMIKRDGVSKKLSDETVKENLKKVVKLLVYVSDRDLFAEFYKKRLSRRLLFGRCTASEEYEDCFLTNLNKHFGVELTGKIEKMVNDIKLANESRKNFKTYLKENQDLTTQGVDLNVTVLSTSSWPNFKSVDLNLPDEMLKCFEVFKGFYNARKPNSKLALVQSQGTCNIYGNFEAKTIELVVTTCQAAVLLLFNSADKLAYTEIRTRLNINDDDLVPILRSLSGSKHTILKKTPPNASAISQSDAYFEFNTKFTDKMSKIMIALPKSRISTRRSRVVEERKKVEEEVDMDRRYAIDAAIVRIMKRRKALSYQELVSECVEVLSLMFKPDVKAIKKRTDSLITRDYLERDSDDPNKFLYVP